MLEWMQRHLGVATGVLLALAVTACGEDGQARVVVETADGRVTVTATATPALSEASPSAEPTGGTEGASSAPGIGEATRPPEPTEAPPEAATPPPAPTPARTATAAATREPAAVDLVGAPHSTADVRAAVEAREQGFTPVGTARGCEGTAVPALRFWSRDPGSTAGPAFVLWVYPDTAARSADWDTSSGIVLPRVSGCTLPSSATYWNGNVVISFDGYIDDGAPAPRPSGSMRSHPVIDAFLSMAR